MKNLLVCSFVLVLFVSPVFAADGDSVTEQAIKLNAAGDVLGDEDASATEKAVKMDVLNDEDASLTEKALKLKAVDAINDAAK